MTSAGLRYPVSERLGREFDPQTIRDALSAQNGALRPPQALRGRRPDVVSLASQVQPACLREALAVSVRARKPVCLTWSGTIGRMSEPLPVVEVQVPENFPYGGSRHGILVDTVVIHYTGGRNDDPQRVTETWTRPSSEEVREAEAEGREPPKWGREASAHYVVNRAGVVARFMPEEWAAWHCKGQNLRGVGVECCACLGEALTPAQEASLVALVRDIFSRHPITRVTGHRFATSSNPEATNCPRSLFKTPPHSPIDAQRQALKAWVSRWFGEEVASRV